MAMELATHSWISATPWCMAILAALLLFLHRFHRRRYNLPPGPKPWPIIGNLNLISPLPHQSLHTLSQKYGPIMHLRFGSKPVVVGSSVEMAKAFLKTHDATFASRPKFSAGKYTTYNYSDILWAPYGPYLSQARRLCFRHLLCPKALVSQEYIREEENNTLLYKLFISANTTILLKELLYDSNLNIISRMVLGKKYVEKIPSSSSGVVITSDELKKMVDEFLVLNGIMNNIGDLIPWANFLDLQGSIKRMKAFSEKFDRFLEHVLDEHNEKRKGVKDYVAKDMVDVLLQVAEDPTLEVKLERDGVKGITMDLILAGSQSSAIIVEWAISELLKNPMTLKKATEELDRVIGRQRWVKEEDIAKLPYMEAIVKETMRLHPLAPLITPRLARYDCNVGGYDIPKGTIVLVNVWAISRDPSIWDNPNEFFPERFKDKTIDVKGHNFELLPFGAGRRACLGKNLGLKVVQSTLANMVHGFSWRLPDNMKEEDLNMEEISLLTTSRKEPLVVVAEARLPSHLYTALGSSEVHFP